MANAAVDMADFFSKLAPMFFGSGKSTSSTSGNPAGITNAQDLLALIMPQITGTKDTDAVVSNIMQRAAQAFAPVLGSQAQSGLYNSTVKQQLLSEAMARATGESASAVLQHQTAAGQTAASINGNLIKSSQTQSTKTAPVVDPRLSSALALALTGKSIFSNVTKKAPVVTGIAKPPIVGGASAEAASNGVDTAELLGEGSSVAETGVSSIEAAGGADLLAGGAAGELGVDAAGEIVGDTAAGFGFPYLSAAKAVGNLFGINEIGDAVSGVEGAIGGVVDGGVQALSGVVQGVGNGISGVADGIGDALGDVGGAISDAVDSVICTELVSQGLLDEKLYRSGGWYNGALNPATVTGYHFLAKPYVRLMKRSNIATSIVRPWAVGRYTYISGTWNFKGFLTCKFLEPLCTVIGYVVTPLKRKVAHA